MPGCSSDRGILDAINEMDGFSTPSVNEVVPGSILEDKPEETKIKAQVDTIWEKMNKGVSNKTLRSFTSKPTSTTKKATKETSSNWMTYLGLVPKAVESVGQQGACQKEPGIVHNSTSDNAKKLAAAALAAVKPLHWITEVRDFAGQEIEVKKLVEADSKEAAEKAKAPAPSVVDAVLEQVKKKQKLSVLDKTKKDSGEFKEEKKVLEEELDAYKKS